MIYINGYALLSSIGDNAYDASQTLRYHKPKPITLDSGIKYYAIEKQKTLDYYATIEQVIQDAIKDSGITKESLDNTALFLGTSSAKLPLNEKYAFENNEILFRDMHMEEVTEILANRLEIHGFRTIISTACTASSNALIQAKEMISSGLISQAIVVGVELYNMLSIKGFESFMLLSKNQMQPFDKNRDGIIIGEGVSAVVLSKNESPFKFLGGTIRVDTSSITAPTPENLKRVMQDTLSNSFIQASEIKVLKTHSTGTQQNDEAEAKAIHLLFKETLPKIVTLKPYIGHTMGACGTNELVLFLESLKQGFIPKSIQFNQIDHLCNIVPSTEELDATSGYYMFNYFGFGGNNSSFLVEYQELA